MLGDPMKTSATLHCWSWVQAASEVVPAKAIVSLRIDYVWCKTGCFFQFSD